MSRGLTMLIVSLLVYAPCAAAAQDARQGIEHGVNLELQYLKELADADNDTLQRIRESVKPFVETAARLTAGRPNASIAFRMGVLPPRLQDAIVAAAEPLVADKERFDRYRQDVAARREFRSKAALYAFMVQVDRAIGLRSSQVEAFRVRAEQLAEKGILPDPMSIDIMPASVMRREMAGVLTEPQLEMWKHSRQMVLGKGISSQPAKESVERRREILGESLQLVAEVRIDWLKEELKLSDRTTARLRLASKGAIAGIAAKQVESRDAVRQMLEDSTQNGTPPNFYGRTAQLAMASPYTLFDNYSRWSALLKGALSDSEYAALQEIRTEQMKRERESSLSGLVLSLSRSATLTAAQQAAFREVLATHIPLPKPDAPPESRAESPMKLLARVTDEEVLKAVGEDDGRRILQLLAQMRAPLEAAGKAAGDDGD